MRFWDSSALVPLVVEQAATRAVEKARALDPVQIVWWATPTECAAAIARLEREGRLVGKATAQAFRTLTLLHAGWHEVPPGDLVRATSMRLLRLHSLRSADALQLAAAIVAAEQRPEALTFVCLDRKLAAAAEREGFPVSPENDGRA